MSEYCMKKYYLYLFGLLIVLFVVYQIRIHDLKKVAQYDIDFIHKKILENHPGPCNDQDPDFIKNMNLAYQESKNSIQSKSLFFDHTTVIKKYLYSFNDSHVRFYQEAKETLSKKNLDNEQIFSIIEMPNNVAWITLPTFAPNAEQQHALEKIIAALPKYRTYKVIVFDVRSNTGGSSHWGTRILETLFTKDYALMCIYEMNKNIKINWRASAENVSYLTNLTQHIINQFGENSQEALEFKSIEQGVKEAYQQNKCFYTEQPTNALTMPIKSNNPVLAKIVIITSSRCVSACLDFIDEVKAVDARAILIGQTTDADSVYMELRQVNLPSGIGKLQFPIKVYRNRPRGNNVPYVPDILYPKNISLQQELDQWLLIKVQNLSKD